jgi:hypothetical protein
MLFLWVRNLVADFVGERRLRVFGNRVSRRIFGPKRDEATGSGENFIMRSFMIFTPHPIFCGW